MKEITPKAFLELLIQTFPQTFFAQGRQPLKRGIHLDLLKHFEGQYPTLSILKALQLYRNREYFENCTAGKFRLDLEGKADEVLQEKHVQFSALAVKQIDEGSFVPEIVALNIMSILQETFPLCFRQGDEKKLIDRSAVSKGLEKFFKVEEINCKPDSIVRRYAREINHLALFKAGAGKVNLQGEVTDVVTEEEEISFLKNYQQILEKHTGTGAADRQKEESALAARAVRWAEAERRQKEVAVKKAELKAKLASEKPAQATPSPKKEVSPPKKKPKVDKQPVQSKPSPPAQEKPSPVVLLKKRKNPLLSTPSSRKTLSIKKP